MIKKRILAFILIIITLILLIYYIINIKEDYVFVSNDLSLQLIEKYDDLNLRQMDYYDISTYFGLAINDMQNVLFISDFSGNDENVFNPKELIIIVDRDENRDFYNYLRDYVEMNARNIETEEKLLYEKAIIEENDKVIYLVMGSKQEEISEYLKEYFK